MKRTHFYRIPMTTIIDPSTLPGRIVITARTARRESPKRVIVINIPSSSTPEQLKDAIRAAHKAAGR